MSNPSDSRPSARGDTEPTASLSPVPVWLIALMLVLLYVGAVYFDHHSGWFNARVYAPYRSGKELALYQPKSGAEAILAEGRATYDSVCGLCHGQNGEGKPGQAPPLAGSRFVSGDIQTFAHIPLTGLSGPVTVKGKQYNLSMPPMGAAMSDAKLAAVLSYIRHSWGNKGSMVTPAEVKSARSGSKVKLPSGAAWAKLTPVGRGRAVFVAYNCAQCHGSHGQGGVPNPNAKSGQQVPGLIHVADGFTKSELKAFIKKGVRDIPRLHPKGPAPPKFMPAWAGIISDTNLNYLVDYLFSLKPKNENLGF